MNADKVEGRMCMEQNVENNAKKELTILDLWKIFRNNIVLLIVIALIGAIAIGALGGCLAYFNKTYSATLNFSVSHSDSTDALLYNLQSESFAEKLLLDENGLPPKEECDAKDYEAALAAVKAFDKLREDKKELKQEINKLQTSVIEYKKSYYDQEYSKIFGQLSVYKGANSDVIADDEHHKEMIVTLEAQLSQILAERAKFMEEEYNPASIKKREYDEAYSLLSIQVNEARREAEALVEKVVAPWRANEDVKKKMDVIKESVSYEYAKLEASSASDDTTGENQNKGYIKIYVEVQDDEELADYIVESLKSRTGPFVEKHIEKMTNAARVDCKLISTFSSLDEVGDGLITSVVKFGVIGGVGLFVLTYIVLVLKDMIALYAVDGEDDKKKLSKKTKSE